MFPRKMAMPRWVRLTIFALMLSSGTAQSQYDREIKQTTGVFYDWGSISGYNLFSSGLGILSILVDNDGKELHRWKEPDGYRNIGNPYLTKQGTLIKAVDPVIDDDDVPFFESNESAGGRIREYDVKGKCIWELRYYSSLYSQVGDFVVLPNGNVLFTALENHSLFTAKARGYKGEPNKTPYGFWTYTILEVPRKGKLNEKFEDNSKVDDNPDNTCEYFSDESDIKWRWDSFDQMTDFIKDGTWDINKKFEINSIDYLPFRDHILINCRACGEVFIIDHSIEISKVQFGSGQFIYRWGNPENYGKPGKKKLDAEIAKFARSEYGYKFDYEGKVIAINNVDPEEKNKTSSVVQFDPPSYNGKYYTDKDGTFGPKDFDYKVIKFQEKVKVNDVKETGNNFFGYGIEATYEYPWTSLECYTGGFAQKFPIGDFLVTCSDEATVYEVYRKDRGIWKYASPYINHGIEDTLLGEDYELEKFTRVTKCGSVPCNYFNGMTKYDKKYEAFEVLSLIN